MPKKILIALPPAMLEQIDIIADTEHRTRSDLVREALRRYIDNFKRTQGASIANAQMAASTAALAPVQPLREGWDKTPKTKNKVESEARVHQESSGIIGPRVHEASMSNVSAAAGEWDTSAIHY